MKPMLVLLGALCLAPSAFASPITYVADLAGLTAAPPNTSPGIGVAEVEVDDVAHTLSVRVSFSGLLGPTTGASIHCCVTAPGTVGIATQTPFFAGFPIGVTAGTFFDTYDTTLPNTFGAGFVNGNGGSIAQAEAALFAGLAAGTAYFNIRTLNPDTGFFAAGEIRGFLRAASVQEPATVPEPASVALMLAGIGGVTLSRRRRSAG